MLWILAFREFLFMQYLRTIRNIPNYAETIAADGKMTILNVIGYIAALHEHRYLGEVCADALLFALFSNYPAFLVDRFATLYHLRKSKKRLEKIQLMFFAFLEWNVKKNRISLSCILTPERPYLCLSFSGRFLGLRFVKTWNIAGEIKGIAVADLYRSPTPKSAEWKSAPIYCFLWFLNWKSNDWRKLNPGLFTRRSGKVKSIELE